MYCFHRTININLQFLCFYDFFSCSHKVFTNALLHFCTIVETLCNPHVLVLSWIVLLFTQFFTSNEDEKKFHYNFLFFLQCLENKHYIIIHPFILMQKNYPCLLNLCACSLCFCVFPLHCSIMIISLMVVENDVVTTCFFVFFVILFQNLLHIFDLLPFKKNQPYFIVVTNW